MFEGKPVYIEFTAEGRVFTIITEEWRKKRPPFEHYHPGLPDPYPVYHEYDVDYCDSHGHYHASLAGSGYFPRKMCNRVDEQHNHVVYTYWIASHLSVEFSEGVDPAYCTAISATDLLPLILTDEGYREEFVATYPELTVDELITYWYEQAHDVEEGRVVYCALCDRSYDYEAWVPCEHIRWCDTCGDWSTPGGDCEHRTEDGTYYMEPEEADEEVDSVEQVS